MRGGASLGLRALLNYCYPTPEHAGPVLLARCACGQG